MKIFNFIAVFMVLSLVTSAVHAEEATEESGFTAGHSIVFDLEKEKEKELKQARAPIPLPNLNIPEEAEVTVVQDKHAGHYVLATVENLSKLYWQKNALNLSNDKAIDNFLLINECPIYQRFYDDDFEWLRVRKAARAMLSEKKEGFPQKFKMTIPVDLGRYDMEKKGFPLINGSQFLDLRRVEIGGNSSFANVCGNTKKIEHYPRNMILVLSKPFNYDFISLDEHIAQAYIVRQKYEPAKRPKALQNKKFNRLAFARMRITFDRYQGRTKGLDGQPLAVMFGRLDGIDIFEDANEKRLLSSTDF